MPSLEVQLEKAEKALKALQADLEEKKKSPTEGNKYAVAAFIKKDPKLADYRRIYVKLDAAKAKVERLKTKIYNKKQGGRTRRRRRSNGTRKNGH
jgi:hypothetical protein